MSILIVVKEVMDKFGSGKLRYCGCLSLILLVLV